MSEMIWLWSPFIPPETADEIKKVLDSGWLNTGPQEKQFREKLNKKFSFANSITTNSGTAALNSSLAYLNLQPGDEVITTPWTFIATNTTILEQRGKPVFADIYYDTLNIDPESVSDKITQKTKAIMCVHFAGCPCEMDELRKIGKENNIPVIEDSAHAIGAKYRGKYIGSKGDLCCFSFQVIKIINCGDGGLITTSKSSIIDELKKIVWFGVDRSGRNEDSIDRLPDDIDRLGFKANMNDIAATLGLCGLKHIDEALQKRKETAKRYSEELSNCEKTTIPIYPNYVDVSNHIYPIHVQDRQRFAEHMKKNKIQTLTHNRRNDAYTIFGGKRKLPITNKVDMDHILIPIHTSLSDFDIDRIVRAIKEYDKI